MIDTKKICAALIVSLMIVGCQNSKNLTVAQTNDFKFTDTKTAIYQVTYLDAPEGGEQALEEFIKRHWFAMDAEGLRQGIFTSYELFSVPDEQAGKGDEYDFAMIVGYPQALAYDDKGTQEVFTKIRNEHIAQYPEAGELSKFGKVVGQTQYKATQ